MEDDKDVVWRDPKRLKLGRENGEKLGLGLTALASPLASRS